MAALQDYAFLSKKFEKKYAPHVKGLFSSLNVKLLYLLLLRIVTYLQLQAKDISSHKFDSIHEYLLSVRNTKA